MPRSVKQIIRDDLAAIRRVNWPVVATIAGISAFLYLVAAAVFKAVH